MSPNQTGDERFEVEDEFGNRYTVVSRFMPGGVGGVPGTVAYETIDGRQVWPTNSSVEFIIKPDDIKATRVF